MSYKSQYIVNSSDEPKVEEIKEHTFRFISNEGLGGSKLILYESKNKILFETKLIAKWFKDYTDKTKEIDFHASFLDIPEYIMKKIIIEKYDYINDLYSKRKVTIIKKFDNKSNIEIYKKIKNWEMDNTFMSFVNIEKFLKVLNVINRKEKIESLLT